MAYKLQTNGVLRLFDKAFIPENLSNTDWQEYQKWLRAGNTPEPQYTQEELDSIEEERQHQIRINNAIRRLKVEPVPTDPTQMADYVRLLLRVLRLKNGEDIDVNRLFP